MPTTEEKLQQLKKMQTKLDKKTKEVACLQAESAALEKEIKAETEAECINICLDALIVGTDNLRAKHGESAPYSTSYYVNDIDSPVKHEFCRAVTSNKFEDLPAALYRYFCKQGWAYEQFLDLKKRSDKLWKALPTSYTPNFYKTEDRNELHRHHIANGYETDGFDNIVKGYLGGTYSSYTTCSQNDLSITLIALKGFCTEYYLSRHPEQKDMFAEVFSRHGIDSDLSDLNAWAKRNPTRCMSNNPNYIGKGD